MGTSVRPWSAASVVVQHHWTIEDLGRGLHSTTFQLNLSNLYGIGGARKGCVARVRGVLGGVLGV